MEIEPGDTVKDIYTGFSGIASARTKWFTGCDRILIEPTDLDKDGKVREGVWFDALRVEFVKAREVKPEAAPAAERPGGPRPDPRNDRPGE